MPDDPYYQPEAFGLTTVGEVEWSEPDYSFDLTVLWKDAAGTLHWADDSGCSCPSPFEDYTTLESLETGTFHEFASHLNARLAQMRGSEFQTRDVIHAEPQVVDLLAKVREV